MTGSDFIAMCFIPKIWRKKITKKNWIGCDTCALKMHIQCIPETQRELMSLFSDFNSDNIDYVCEICLS